MYYYIFEKQKSTIGNIATITAKFREIHGENKEISQEKLIKKMFRRFFSNLQPEIFIAKNHRSMNENRLPKDQNLLITEGSEYSVLWNVQMEIDEIAEQYVAYIHATGVAFNEPIKYLVLKNQAESAIKNTVNDYVAHKIREYIEAGKLLDTANESLASTNNSDTDEIPVRSSYLSQLTRIMTLIEKTAPKKEIDEDKIPHHIQKDVKRYLDRTGITKYYEKTPKKLGNGENGIDPFDPDYKADDTDIDVEQIQKDYAIQLHRLRSYIEDSRLLGRVKALRYLDTENREIYKSMDPVMDDIVKVLRCIQEIFPNIFHGCMVLPTDAKEKLDKLLRKKE